MLTCQLLIVFATVIGWAVIALFQLCQSSQKQPGCKKGGAVFKSLGEKSCEIKVAAMKWLQ